MREILDELRSRREADAERFANLDWDECMLCGAYGEDKRTLFVSCFYDVKEVVPEAIDLFLCGDVRSRGYCLRICKTCRGAFLMKMRDWRLEQMSRRRFELDHDGHETW